MQNIFLQFATKFVKNLVQLDNELPHIPKPIINYFMLSKAILGLTYLQYRNQGYIYLISIIGRPQLYLDKSGIQFFFLAISIIYLISIFVQVSKNNLLVFHGIMMRTNYFNLCLEISQIPLSYFTQPLSILIGFINQLLLLESLDIEERNFNKTKVDHIDQLIFLLITSLSLFDFYGVNKYLIYVNILLLSILSLINSISIIEASIHFFTIIITLFEIFGDISQQTSLLIIFPLICKIFSRFDFDQIKSNKQKSFHNFKEQLIGYSILIKRKNYLQSLKMLSQFDSKSFILQIKREQLKKKCIRLIYNNISGNYNKQSILVDCYEKIIENEEESVNIISEISEIIKQKLELLQNEKQENFFQYQEYLYKITQFEKKITKIQSLNLSRKNNTIIIFFYSEIMNDFSKARLYMSSSKNTLQFENNNFNRLSYIISNYDSDFKIVGISKNNCFQKESHFELEDHIPPGVKQYHKKLVEFFIQNGYSKYYKQFETSFIVKEYQNIMTSVDFGILVHGTDSLQFITFLQPSLEQTMTMILNSQLFITCISELLAQSLNISFYDIRHLGYSIKKFIPQYNQNLTYQESLDVIVYELEQEMSYIASINQNIRIIDDQIIYYVIHFESLRKSNNKIRSLTVLSQQQSFYEQTSVQDQKSKPEYETILQISIPEEDQADLPYDNNQSSYSEQINFSQDENKISSPCNNDMSKQKLIRRTSFATKFKKQCSQLVADDINQLKFPFESKRRRDDFLVDFYQQKLDLVSKFFIVFFCTLMMAFIFFLFQTLESNLNINLLIDNIDVLEFAQLCFQPFENNILMIFSISEYQYQYLYKKISANQLKQFSSFPAQEIVEGYQEIYENFNSLFNENLLQQILDENIIEAYQYTNSSNIDVYNITLRKAFGILLQFQYDSFLEFQRVGKVNAETTHTYYIFKNYMTLKFIVINLNVQLLDQTINHTEESQRKTIILLVVGLIVISFFYLVIYIYFLGIKNQINRYYNILSLIPKFMIENQIQNLKYLLHQINQDNQFVFRYKYNEQKLGIEKENQNYKRTKKQNKLYYSGWRWRACFFILFSLIVILASISFFITKQYFQGYGDIAKLYKSISDLSIDVASMYSVREVLYFKQSFSYLKNDTIKQLLQVIDDGLNRTKTFRTSSLEINNTIMSESFKQQYQSVISSDLCAQLTPDLQNKSSSFCSSLFGGNMKNGLIVILTTIINNLETEKNFSQFLTRTNLYQYDLEGPFLVSNIISKLFKNMKQDLISQTVYLIKVMNIINGSLLSILASLILLSYSLFFKKLSRQLEISKRFITFIPLSIILFDDGIERYVKNLVYKNNSC